MSEIRLHICMVAISFHICILFYLLFHTKGWLYFYSCIVTLRWPLFYFCYLHKKLAACEILERMVRWRLDKQLWIFMLRVMPWRGSKQIFDECAYYFRIVTYMKWFVLCAILLLYDFRFDALRWYSNPLIIILSGKEK